MTTNTMNELIKKLMSKMAVQKVVGIRHHKVADTSRLEALLADHLKYVTGLEAAGYVFASGPVFSEEGGAAGEGLTILKNVDLEKARELWSEEPFYKNGIRKSEFFLWDINEGQMSITVNLSTSDFSVL